MRSTYSNTELVLSVIENTWACPRGAPAIRSLICNAYHITLQTVTTYYNAISKTTLLCEKNAVRHSHRGFFHLYYHSHSS